MHDQLLPTKQIIKFFHDLGVIEMYEFDDDDYIIAMKQKQKILNMLKNSTGSGQEKISYLGKYDQL